MFALKIRYLDVTKLIFHYVINNVKDGEIETSTQLTPQIVSLFKCCYKNPPACRHTHRKYYDKYKTVFTYINNNTTNTSIYRMLKMQLKHLIFLKKSLKEKIIKNRSIVPL